MEQLLESFLPARVVKVCDGVYSAVGYSMANSILIEAPNGNIIVDTTENNAGAKLIMDEFRKINDKPIIAIIYTHSHRDHFGGTKEFLNNNTSIPIYAHKSFMSHFSHKYGTCRPILTTRGLRQFGTYLNEDEFITNGIGYKLEWEIGVFPDLYFPTVLLQGKTNNLNLGGLDVTIVHAPGETTDQIFVWIPSYKTLLCADNWYLVWPNLYSIRGTRPRPIDKWINSLDMMRELHADYLVPSHGPPVIGAEQIYENLTIYRDCIQFVRDATLQGINQNKTADELVDEIKLPKHIAEHPVLGQYYGNLSHSIRTVFNNCLGHFDGNPTNLEPYSLKEKSARLLKICDPTVIMNDIIRATNEEDYQWVLELTDFLSNDDTKPYRINALRKLGKLSTNCNNRNYYLTCALELEGKVHIDTTLSATKEQAHMVPLDQIFEVMPVNLNQQASIDTHIKTNFIFTDCPSTYQVTIRHGIAESRPGSTLNPDLIIEIDSNTWKEIALNVMSSYDAYKEGKMKLKHGDINTLKNFGSLFQWGLV